MKVILYVLMLAVIVCAECEQMSREQAQSIADGLWETTHSTMLVQNGVNCDHGVFVKLMDPVYNMHACLSFTYKDYKGVIIAELHNYREIQTVYYDEYGMIIKEDKRNRTNKSCVDLYKAFKRNH